MNHKVLYGHMAVICATTNPMRIALCVSPNYPNPSPSNLLHWVASAAARGHRTLGNPTLTILERFPHYDPTSPHAHAHVHDRLAWHRAHPPRNMNRRLAAPGTPASRSPYPVTTASPWTVFYTLPDSPQPLRLRSKTSPALTTAKAAAAWFLGLQPAAHIRDVVPGTAKAPEAVARRHQLQQLMQPTYGGYKRLMGL